MRRRPGVARPRRDRRRRLSRPVLDELRAWIDRHKATTPPVTSAGTYVQSGYYEQVFHDIGLDFTPFNNVGGNSGNGCNPSCTPGLLPGSCFQAVPGWDAATGLGTPTCNLIHVATNVRQSQVAASASVFLSGPIICLSGTNFTPGATVIIQYLNVPTGGTTTTDMESDPSLEENGSPVVDKYGNFSLTDFSQSQGVPAPFLVTCSSSVLAGQVTVAITDGNPQGLGGGTGITSLTSLPAVDWCQGNGVINVGNAACSPPPVPECAPGSVACGAGCCPSANCQAGTQGLVCCASTLCGGICCDGGSCVNGACCLGSLDATGSCCPPLDILCSGECCDGTCLTNGSCCSIGDNTCGAVCCGQDIPCADSTTSMCGAECPTGLVPTLTGVAGTTNQVCAPPPPPPP
jgi:hypothetical protein